MYPGVCIGWCKKATFFYLKKIFLAVVEQFKTSSCYD